MRRLGRSHQITQGILGIYEKRRLLLVEYCHFVKYPEGTGDEVAINVAAYETFI